MTDNKIIDGFKSFDEDITKEYFYGYCRKAYNIYDYKYQLHKKTGLDFYSLAHDYYIHLLRYDFKPLLSKPENLKLSTWMTQGFHFVVLDALKVYNKEFEHQSEEAADVVLEYIRSSNKEDEMLLQVAEAVTIHYHDRIMSEIGHMIFYGGFKQKEVAEQLKMTPAAINQRYKKMMTEVVIPFVIENYGTGQYTENILDYSYDHIEESMSDNQVCYLKKTSSPVLDKRITPPYIISLKPNEIFVFGSNLQGIHAGGTARIARLHFGAVMGNGVGLQGQSYAIPTMQGDVETIRPYVDEFIKYASQHKDQNFLVTPIGCGLAGFEPEDIAPLFTSAKEIDNIYLPESFWDVIKNISTFFSVNLSSSL